MREWKDRTQTEKLTVVLAEQGRDVTAVPPTMRSRLYGVMRADTKAGLQQALLDIGPTIDRSYVDASGLKAIVIQKVR